MFVHVVFKFLELLDHFYDYSFKFYDLRVLQVILIGAHFYGTGRFGSPYCLGLSQCLCLLQWNVGMWPNFFLLKCLMVDSILPLLSESLVLFVLLLKFG